MLNRIPEGIRAEHILAAIEELSNGAPHPFRESTRYDLLFEGQRYAPKAVIGLAAVKLPGGRPLGPYDFKGGLESKCFEVLEANGFTIVPKLDQPDPGVEGAAKRTRKTNGGSQGNPDWTRDELIIALNVYLQTRPRTPGQNSEEIGQLSTTLNKLGERLFTQEQRTATFRNSNGVYMKLANFKRFDPSYTATEKGCPVETHSRKTCGTNSPTIPHSARRWLKRLSPASQIRIQPALGVISTTDKKRHRRPTVDSKASRSGTQPYTRPEESQ